MKNSKQTLIGIAIIAAIIFLALVPVRKEANAAFHSPEELVSLKAMMMVAAFDSTQYFPSSKECGGCHGFDFEGFALVDAEGQDINIYDDWRSSMMANSAKDPFWRAKVSHEVLVNPGHSEALQTTCTSCHAPMGHYSALYRGHDVYLMDSLLLDTLGLDGVSCGACHQISEENLGQQFSGQITYDTNRVQYGPYESPFGAPMISFAGFSPIYSEHINDAGICAPCHSLVVETANIDGTPTGSTFVEQATYHEWLNSKYNEDSISCQACHLPQIQDSVVISDNYLFLQGRSPFGKHEMVGANTFMLKLMKENKEELGIDATDENYDETIAKTFQMLQQRSIDLDLQMLNADLDSAYFRVEVINKAGHKFPSGYPSRRAFIQFTVTTEDSSYLFSSGLMDDDYEVIGQDEFYEPHYQVINQTEQVQIYEVINTDVNGDFSTILERAFVSVKDNRLPPLGFTTTHEVYDTTLIAGNALTDADFNRDASGEEGTGGDVVYYHVPLQGYNGLIDVTVRVYYQSLPPKWMEEIFAASTPEIETFRTMYNNADQSPVLVKEEKLEDIFINTINTTELAVEELQLFPNPSSGLVNLPNTPQPIRSIKIFNAAGQLVQSLSAPGNSFELPAAKGMYWIELRTSSTIYQSRVVRM